MKCIEIEHAFVNWNSQGQDLARSNLDFNFENAFFTSTRPTQNS